RGRLWATCEACRRWTLAPIDERWEALEELERLSTDRARLLAQTDNISLLRVERMEIVRIGKASLSEQSWWRFGRELIGRHKAYQRASILIIGGIVALQIGVAAAVGGGMAYAYMFAGGIQDWLRKRKFGKEAWRGQGQCPNCGAPLETLKFDHRKKLIIAPGENDTASLHYRCRHCKSYFDTGAHLFGTTNDLLMRRVLAFHHYEGAKENRIVTATRTIEAAGSAEDLIRSVASERRPIGKIDKNRLLALEIAVNADAERQLLEMELADLEERWREEEEIAAIVDGELTPVAGLDKLIRQREE
ncbi:MAG: hypothetical protein P8Y10_15880, partial [Gemmatimonadales bacterium]